MNYKKIYDNLVSNALKRTDNLTIVEKHHILPKSLGGDNKHNNMVNLSLREHFIAHKLLVKIYKKVDSIAHKKMIYVLWFMCKNNKLRKVKSRDYEEARLLFSINNPNKCAKRKELFRKKHKAGEYQYDYDKVSQTLRITLSELSSEQMENRLNNSIRMCDHVARGKAIQRGKASLLSMTKDNKTVEFWSYEAVEKTGIEYRKIYYIIKNKNGEAPDGVYYQYIKKYKGGNKWKKQQ